MKLTKTSSIEKGDLAEMLKFEATSLCNRLYIYDLLAIDKDNMFRSG